MEAKLGALPGDEDVSTDAVAKPATMTGPRQAAEFVAATGVDALAVAVGNVHGFTKDRVRLDLDQLAAIHAAVPVPRVLHGAGAGGLPVGERATGVDPPAAAVGNVHGFTENPVRVGLERLAAIQAAVPVPRVLHGAGAGGLPVGELHGALARGVAQVNVDAELRRACLEAVRATLPAALPGAGVVSVGAAGRAAIRDAALEAIGRLSPRAEGRGGTATRLWRSPAP